MQLNKDMKSTRANKNSITGNKHYLDKTKDKWTVENMS